MNTPEIRLTDAEIRMCVEVATLRRLTSIHQGYHNRFGMSAYEWEHEIQGAAAEAAYCKLTNVWFPGTVNGFKGADVGKNLQVRQTRYARGVLELRKGDNEQHVYVLVTGGIPIFRFPGWIVGMDGMKPEFLGKLDPERPECWCVPQSALNPIEVLNVERCR